MGQSDSTQIRFLEAHEKLSELESMTKYINDMISQYMVPVGIYSSSDTSVPSSSYESYTSNY